MLMPAYFAWTEEELACLKEKDARLAAFIELAGPLQRTIIPDLFTALMHSIAGQQISGRVHVCIWERMQAALPDMTPAAVLALGADALRSLGLSARKVDYILGAARAFATGRLSAEALTAMDDDAFCASLTSLRGVGQWTAEMLLIFCLQRKNVLSFGDYGIRRGLRMLCRRREITPALFARCKKRFSPYCSLASFYLWELASGCYEGYTDPGQPARKDSGRAAEAKAQRTKPRESAAASPAARRQKARAAETDRAAAAAGTGKGARGRTQARQAQPVQS